MTYKFLFKFLLEAAFIAILSYAKDLQRHSVSLLMF